MRIILRIRMLVNMASDENTIDSDTGSVKTEKYGKKCSKSNQK